MPTDPYSAASDLGLGTMLGDQTKDMTEEERRRRRLGLSPLGAGASPAVQSLFGLTGVASPGGAGGRGY